MRQGLADGVAAGEGVARADECAVRGVGFVGGHERLSPVVHNAHHTDDSHKRNSRAINIFRFDGPVMLAYPIRLLRQPVAPTSQDQPMPPRLDPDPPVRLNILAPAKWVRAVDEWRRHQDDLPNLSEAIRRLVEVGMEATKRGKRGK